MLVVMATMAVMVMMVVMTVIAILLMMTAVKLILTRKLPERNRVGRKEQLVGSLLSPDHLREKDL